MRKTLCIISLFQLTMGFSQVSTAVNNPLNIDYFQNINTYSTSDFILDKSNFDSLFYIDQIGADTTTVNQWLTIYNDLWLSNINETRIIDSLHVMYHFIEVNRYASNDLVNSIPLGLIDVTINQFKSGLIESGELIFDGEYLQYTGATSPFIEKHVFKATIIDDTVDIHEPLRLYFNDTFQIIDDISIEYELFYENQSLGLINFIDYVDINLHYGENNFEILNTSSNKRVYFKLIGTESNKLKNASAFTDFDVDIALTQEYFESGIDGQIVGAKAKFFFGCDNETGLPKRPFIFVCGYNPANLRSFNKYVEIYNSNFLLDELHKMNYDVIVVRFNYGADRLENGAFVLTKILKDINDKKFVSGDYTENNLIGYSAGAVIARLALKMMEVEFEQNPIPANLHHSKLCISYDGEQKGANVPLTAQHALISLIQNPQWYLPNSLLNLLDILDHTDLISSPMAKDFLIYHYLQTGTSATPNQGHHAYFTDVQNKFNTIYYHDAYDYSKPGDYPYVRNVGISQGASEAFGYWPMEETQSPNSILLQIDKTVNVVSAKRHSFNQWDVMDGDAHSIFKRKFEKKWFWQTTWDVLLDEKYSVNNDAAKIDAAPGSTMSMYNSLRTAIITSYLSFNPDVDIEGDDCFLPVTSALDIQAHSGSYFYNLKDHNLLWDVPPSQIITEQTKQYGYPSIVHGISQYAYTPFDAIYCSKYNGQHGAKYEPGLIDLTTFILSEAHFDDIQLQFLNLGQWAQGQFRYYPAKFAAVTSIETGENVTFKTQYKPFIVLPNSEIELLAGESISMMPGTTIQQGADFHAHIGLDFFPCDIHGKMNDNNDGVIESTLSNNNVLEKKSGDLSHHTSFIYPNPSSTYFVFENLDNFDFLEITDNRGIQILKTTLHEGSNRVDNELESGFYLVRAVKATESITLKIYVL